MANPFVAERDVSSKRPLMKPSPDSSARIQAEFGDGK
jgi:hypothetical protein